MQKALDTIDVQPTITAHPTEAKRVTVLEIHRRIYLKLYELESPRWTPRERTGLVMALRNEIDILWMTGEIRLEKPTVQQEIQWGLHFFRETLFERTSGLCELLEAALRRHYPEDGLRVKPPLRFSSWIGGDRDGNPYVTVDVTREALAANRRAAMERIDRRLNELTHLVSLSSSEAAVPETFMAQLTHQLELSGRGDVIIARNRHEPFRQYFSSLRARLTATGGGDPKAKPFASVAELASCLLASEEALARMQAISIASSIVRPVRWEVEIFGFRTASLDLRQNTTVINRVLAELWRKLNPLDANERPNREAKRGPNGSIANSKSRSASCRGFVASPPRPRNCWTCSPWRAKSSKGLTRKRLARSFCR
ncbi:MAG: phosphoenolpyruvate carboxylase [Rhizobiales bacterium]|nr:phosphoenolpyruvate carboxylase [Hyphomicrobiales bacterium]